MTTLLKSIVLICICGLATTTFSQNYSFDDLVGFELLDAGPITSKNEIQGYYLFFEKDRKSKDSTEYIVKLLDQNLNELTNKEFTSSPNTAIEALVFNGKSVLVKQFEVDGQKLHFKTQALPVQGELQLLGEQTIRMHKHSRSSVHPIADKGFVNIYGTNLRKAIVEFYSDGQEAWRYETTDGTPWEEVDYITTQDNTLIFSMLRPNSLSSDGDYYLTGLDYRTGEQVFEQKLSDFGNNHKISRGFINPVQEEIWLIGDYYNRGEVQNETNSNGIFIMRTTFSGEIKDTDYIAWNDKKLERQAQQYQDGKLKAGNIYMHDFVFLNTGEVFGIGEQFRKAFRPLGVLETLTTLGLYGRMSEVHIGDILLMKFGTNAQLVDRERERKPAKKEFSNTGAYGGVFLPKKRIGELMDQQGDYDFSHLSVDNDHNSFTVFYLEKEQLSRRQLRQYSRVNRNILRTVTYNNKEFTSDKFYLSEGKTDGEVFQVLPAKPGYVVVHEISEDYEGLRLEKVQ